MLGYHLQKLASPLPALRKAAAHQLGLLGDKQAIPDLVAALRDDNHTVVAEVERSLISIGGPEVVSRVTPMLSLEQVGLRNAAMNILRSIGDDAPDHILNMMGESDRDLRIFAAELLSHLNFHGVGRVLINALRDPDPSVRLTAAVSLGRRREIQAVSALINLLHDEEWICFAAVEALGLIGDPAAVQPLVDLAVRQPGLMSGACAEALGNIVDPRSAQYIISALSQAPAYLMPYLMRALAHQYQNKARLELAPEVLSRVTAGLLEALDDAMPDLRARALEGLAFLGNPETAGKIIELLKCEREKSVLIQARRALAAMLDAPAILSAVVDPTPQVAEVAAEVLGRGNSPQSLQALLKALEHPAHDVRCQAVRSLGLRKARDSYPKLLSFLAQENSLSVCSEIIEVLGILANPEAVPTLADFVKDHHPGIRSKARRALLAIGGDQARQAFIAGLSHENHQVRGECAEALGIMGPGSGGPELVGLLRDARPTLRKAALKALAQIAEPEIWEELGEVLFDPAPEVRKTMFEALAVYDHPAVLGFASMGLYDQEPEIQLLSMKILGRRKARGEIGALTAMLKQGNPQIKIGALDALAQLGLGQAVEQIFYLIADDDPAVRKKAMDVLWVLHNSVD